MRSIDNENDPRILKELLKLAQSHIQYQDNLIKKIITENNEVLQKKFSAEESLLILRKKFFGKLSEKSIKDETDDFDRLRSADESELTLHSQNLVPPVSKKQTKKLDEEIIYSELTELELKEASVQMNLQSPSFDQWEKLDGLVDESVMVTVIERKYVRKLIRRQKYMLKKEFNTTEKESVIITAENPEIRLLPGCGYSVEFATAVIVDKYLYHLPLERQCREMKSLDLLNMSTQVLYNVSRMAGLHFENIAEEIKSEILSLSLVHGDETPWPINNKKDSDGYMWIVSNQAGSYYRFEPTRSGKIIKETLSDYEGWLMTDGYSGYNQFKEKKDKNILELKIRLAQCHAHARRYFKDVEESNPEITEYLNFYKELSSFEKQAKDFEDLHDIRQKKSKPLIERMHAWLLDQLPKSRPELGFRKAIKYSLNNWSELIKFLDDPVIPLTNNEAERSIRQVVMGRKNFYGSRSIDGADLAALMYTVIESCKKFEIDPRNYILETLKLSAAKIETLTPYKFALKLRSQQPA